MPTILRDKVTVGSVTFNDMSVLPLPNTLSWGVDILDGWNSTPDLDAQFGPRGAVDGEVAADFFPLRGRQIMVGGYVFAADRTTAEQLWDVIIGDAFPRNEELMLTRYDTVPKFVRGYRVGKVESSWVGPYGFRFGAEVHCIDPLKYEITPQIGTAGINGGATGGRTYPRTYPLVYTTIGSGGSNSVVINNVGNSTSTRFSVDINGPVANGWRLFNDTTGMVIGIATDIPSSSSLVLDFYEESAAMDGSPVTSPTIGDYWTLVKGPNVIRLYAEYDPAANFTVTAYSAWE